MKNNLLSIFLLVLISFCLGGCSYFYQGKISQDKLPWIKSGEVMLNEDFSDPKTNWEEVSNAYELKRYSAQGYFVSINPINGRSISTSGKVFKDAKFSVEAQKITGPENTNYGLVCRYMDKQNFYAFVVAADGYVGIYKVQAGKTTLLSGEQYMYTDIVKQDDGTNVLVASCNDEILSLNVNGKDLLTVKDWSFEIGEIGLFLETTDEGSASAVFNKFIAVKP